MKNAYKSKSCVQNDVLAAAISREITAMTRRSLAPRHRDNQTLLVSLKTQAVSGYLEAFVKFFAKNQP